MTDTRTTWWRKLIGSGKNNAAGQRWRRLSGRWLRVRLMLEQLEDRVVPTIYTWTGLGATDNWSNPANWGGAAPAGTSGTDDLVFPATLTPGASYISNNDIAAGTFDSIVLKGGGYLLTGNALTLNPTTNGAPYGISDTGNNVIQLGSTGITLGASETFTTTAGTLVLAYAGANSAYTISEGASTLTVTGAGNTTITGVITGSSSATGYTLIKGLTSSDSGTLTISGANNFTGATAINDGIVNVQNVSALGATEAATIAAGADLQLQGGINVPASVTVTVGGTIENVSGNNTLSGTIALAGASGTANILVDQGTLTFSGPISDGGANLGLTTGGPGTVVLAPAAGSSYGGPVNVTAGLLSVTQAGALGTGSVTVTGGASLQLKTTSPLVFTNPLTLAGPGVNNAGALQNSGSSNTWAGSITLNGSSAIGDSSAGTTLTLSGGVRGSASSALTIVAGSGTVGLAAANTYLGNTIINGSLTLNSAGTIVSPLVTVNATGALILDDTGANVNNRLGGAALALNGGAFTLLGSSSTTTSESVGAVALNPGSATIDVVGGTGQTATLTLASLSRSVGATVNFLGLAAGSSSINITNVSSVPLVNHILPFAIVNSSSFTTYSGANNTLAGYSGDATTLVGAGPTTNVVLTGNATVGTAQTINSLIINGTLTVAGPGALTIGSGGLLTTSGHTGTISAPLVFNTEGIVNTEASGTTSIGTSISGTGALTVAGPGTLALGTSNNSYSGGTNLVQGTLSLGSNANLGAGAITLIGGTFSPTAALSFPNPVNVDGSVTFGTSTTTFLGNTVLTGNSVVTATQAVLFQGVVSGSGSLTVASGASTVTLGNANTYTGGTTILAGGGLTIGNNNALGNATSPLTLSGGALASNIAVTIPNPVVFGNASVTLRGVNNLTFGRSTTLIGSDTFAVTNGGLTAFTGTIGGAGALTVTGGGVLSLAPTSGANTYTGGTTLGSTTITVMLGDNNVFGSGTLFLNGGILFAPAAVNLANNVMINGGNNSISGSLSNSGTLTLSGSVILAGNSTFTTSNSTTIAGIIGETGGSHGFTVAGLGVLTLSNANYYTGTTTLFAAGPGTGAAISTIGTLVVGSNMALGSGTIALTAGALSATTPVVLGNPVVFNASSTPVAFTGSSITFNGQVNLLAGTPSLLVSDTATFAGGVTGNAVLTLSGTPLLTRAATLFPTGNLLLNSTDSSSSMTINGGTFTLVGPNGTVLDLTGITVNAGGVFTEMEADNTTLINPSASLTLAGGTFNFVGATGVAAQQTLIALVLDAGNSQIVSVAGTGGTASLTFDVLITNTGAFVNFQAGQTGSLQTFDTATNQIIFSSAPPMPFGILTGATVTDSAADTVTVNGTAGPSTTVKLATLAGSNVVALTSYQALSSSGLNSPSDNVLVSASAALASDTVNSLLVVGDGVGISGTGSTLTVESGMVASTRGTATTTLGNTLSVSNLALSTAAAGVIITNDGELTVSSLITGVNGLTIAGAGILSLPTLDVVNGGFAGYTGTTYFEGGSALNSGTLLLGTNSAIPASSPLVLINGTIGADTYNSISGIVDSGPVNLTNAMTFGGTNASAVTSIVFGAGAGGPGTTGNLNSITLSGTVAMDGATNVLTSNIGNPATPGQPPALFITGVVSGPAAAVANVAGNALVKQGAGTLILTGTNTSYFGATLVNQGIVNDQNASGFGQPLTGGPVVVASGAAVQLETGLAKTFVLIGAGVTNGAGTGGALENLTNTSDGFTSAVTLLGATTIGVNVGQITLGGGITGAGDLTKVGAGTLSVAAASSGSIVGIGSAAPTYTGQIYVNSGIVQATAATAFGVITGGVTVASGATVVLGSAGTATYAGKQLTLNGNGLGLTNSGLLAPTGALATTNNSAAWTGNIILATSSSISSSSVTLTLTGVISDNGSSTPSSLTKVGSGTLVLSNVDTYFGSTSVSVGVLTLSGNGALPNTAAIVVNENSNGTGTTLTLDNTGTNLANRVNDSASITLNGGLLNYLGGSASTETLGIVTLASGNSTISSTASSGSSAQLTFAALTRTTGATVDFVGGTQTLGSAGNQIEFVAPPALTNGILPYATVQSPSGSLDFASYGSAQTITLGSVTGGTFQLSFNGANTTSIAWSSNGATLAAAIQAALAALPGIGSGNIAVSGSGPFTVNFLNALANSAQPQIAVFSNSLTGLVPSIAVNTITNTASIAAFANYKTSLATAGPTDNVKLTDSEVLAGNLTINSLLLVANTEIPSNLSLTLGSGVYLTLAGGGLMATGWGVNISGGTLNFGSAEGIINANTNLSINSAIAGTNGLTISDAGASTVALISTGTYTSTGPYSTVFNGPGTLLVGAGTVNTSSALGNGTLLLYGGTFGTASTGGQFAFANPILFGDNSVVTLGAGQNMTLTGADTLGTNGSMVSLLAANIIILGGTMSGPDSLNLVGGAGQLAIWGLNSTYSGGTNLGGGTLFVGDASSRFSGSQLISGPLGTGILNLTGGTIQSSDIALQQLSVGSATIGNPIVFTNANVSIGGAVGTSEMILGTTLTFTGNDSVLGNNYLAITDPGVPTASGLFTSGIFFNGIISGPGNLTFRTANSSGSASTGYVQLSGANTLTGGVSINPSFSGQILTVVVANNNALGTGVAILNSVGIGILQDVGTGQTIANNLLVTNLSGIIEAINPSSSFTFTGNISGLVGLQIGLPNLAGSLPSYSPGTVVFTSAEAYTGSTAVYQGTLDLKGNGALLGSTSIGVFEGATLELDNTVTNIIGRINPTASLTLTGGNFVYLGGAGVASSETIGAVSAAIGSSIISATAGSGGTATLNFSSLTRAKGGLITFQTVNPLVGGTATQVLTSSLNSSPAAVDEINFSTAPTTSGSGAQGSTSAPIIGGAIVNDGTSSITVMDNLGGETTTLSNGFNLATLSGSSSPFAITALTTYAAFNSLGNAGTNVYVNGADSYAATGSDSFNALVFAAGGALQGSVTVSVTSGMVVAANGNDSITTGLTAPTELEAIANGSSSLTINGVISGSTAFTMGGSGLLNLNGAANTFTGAATLDSGTLQLGSTSATVGNTSSVTLTTIGGAFGAATTATIGNPIVLNTGTGAASFTGLGNVKLTGLISGTGSLTVNPGASTVGLTFAETVSNTFTGITTVKAGNVTIGLSSGTTLSAGPLIANGNTTVTFSTTDASAFSSAGTNLILGGVLRFGSVTTETLGGNLILNGGSITTGSATMSVANSVIGLPGSSDSITSVTLALTPAASNPAIVFNVGASATLTAGPLVASATLPSIGVSVTKIGAGALVFAGASANNYSNGSVSNGVTTVNEGTLQLAMTDAIPNNLVIGDFGQSATVQQTNNTASQLGSMVNVFVNGGGTLDVTNAGKVTVGATIGSLDVRGGLVTIGTDTLTLSGNLDGLPGDGGSASITSSATGRLVLAQNSIFTVVDSGSTQGLIVGANIAGTGFGFVKLGDGTLTLSPLGSSSYTGVTTVNEGTLLLGATGAGTVAIPGALIIGDFGGGDGQDVVRFVSGSASSQIASTSVVKVNNSGLLDLNNAGTSASPVTIGSLTMEGGTVNVGTGFLTLNGNLASLYYAGNLNDPYVATGVNVPTITGAGTISLSGSTTADIQPGLISVVDAETGLPDLADMVINPAIAGGAAASFTKVDTGLLRLTGTSPFAGSTNVNGGILLADGSLANSSVTVNTNGILGGTGTVGPTTVSGGTVNPGDPITGTSTLTFNGPVNFSNGGNLTVEVTGNSSAGFKADLLNLGSNTLTLGGTSTLTVDLTGLTGFPSSPITIITDGGTVGTFTTVNLINSGSIGSVTVGYSGNSVTLNTPTFLVSSFVPTATGFTAAFNRAFLNTSTNPIHLYSAIASNANYGPPDVTLTGPNGTVMGSLIVNSSNTGFTFITTDVSTSGGTSGLLAPGTYTATFLSSSTGFQDTNGTLLNNGTNYTDTFTVTAPPAAAVTVSIPDFARGPDSAPADSINITNNTSNGIPLTLSIPAGDAVTSGSVTIAYNTSLLSITGAFPNPSLGGMSFTLSGSSSPGAAIVDFSSPTALGSSSATVNVNLGGLIAYTPSNAAYKSKELLQISSSLNGGTIPTINDDAVQVVAFLGNVSGTGLNYTSLDTGEMLNVSSGADAGFSQFPVVDPAILGGITGDTQISISDILQLEMQISNPGSSPYVPVYPGFPSNYPAGPDPSLSIPGTLTANASGTVLVPVNIDDAMPAGSTGMTVAQLALRYDPTDFSVTAQDVLLGSVPESGTGWTLRTVVDASTGTIGITISSETPIESTAGGSLVVIALHELSTATPGATAIELVSSVTANGQVYSTSVNDQQGPFTLTPAPTNTGMAPGLEGTVVLPSVSAAATVGGNAMAALPESATFVNALSPSAPATADLPASALETVSTISMEATVSEAVAAPDTEGLANVALATPEMVPVSGFTQAPLALIEIGREQNAAALQPQLAVEAATNGYAFSMTAGLAPTMLANLPGFGNLAAQRAADQVFQAMSEGSQSGKTLPAASPAIQGDMETVLWDRMDGGTDETDATNIAVLDGCFAQVADGGSLEGE